MPGSLVEDWLLASPLLECLCELLFDSEGCEAVASSPWESDLFDAHGRSASVGSESFLDELLEEVFA